METKTKLGIGVLITLLLATSSTYYLSQDDDAYYCSSIDVVMICEKLSSGTGTRCYYEDTYKICREGWEAIEIGDEISVEANVEESYPPGTKWRCSPESCIRIN